MGIIISIVQSILNYLANIEFDIFTENGYKIALIRKLHFKVLKINFCSKSIRVGKHIYVKTRGNLSIGYNARIGSFSKFWNYEKIIIGKNFLSAGCLTINTGSHIPETLEAYAKPVEIGDNVWCGVNVTILAGVRIGNNCIIGAGSLVNKDIPDNCIAAGVPAKIIRYIEKENYDKQNKG